MGGTFWHFSVSILHSALKMTNCVDMITRSHQNNIKKKFVAPQKTLLWDCRQIFPQKIWSQCLIQSIIVYKISIFPQKFGALLCSKTPNRNTCVSSIGRGDLYTFLIGHCQKGFLNCYTLNFLIYYFDNIFCFNITHNRWHVSFFIIKLNIHFFIRDDFRHTWILSIKIMFGIFD